MLLALPLLAATPAVAQEGLPADLRPLRDETNSPLLREVGDGLRAQLGLIAVEEPDVRRRLGLPVHRLATEEHGNIVVVRGTNGEFDIDWSNPRNLQSALFSIIEAYYQTHPGSNPDFLSVLTTFNVESPQAFYMPVSNDVRGIGYQHSMRRETFDSAPGLSVNGLIFLNSFRNYLGRMEPLGRFIFNQELGHRWSAFVHYQSGRSTSSSMLGRDCSHWSFFLDSGNSAMEGNKWADNGDGTFSTRNSFFNFGYSQLDRYLMGFAPAEAVEPFFLVSDAGQWDCAQPYRNGDYNPGWYPPIFGGAGQEQVRVRGRRVDITIDDIVAAEGQRQPSYENAPKSFSMVFILAVRQNDQVSEQTLATIDEMRRNLEAQWEADATEPGYEGPNLITTIDGSNEPANPGVNPGGGGAGSVGQPCASFDDCDPDDSDRCVPLRSGVRVCTRVCEASADCPRGFCCQQSVPGDPNFNSYCIQSDAACNDPEPPGGQGGAGGEGGSGGEGGGAPSGQGGDGGGGGAPGAGGEGGQPGGSGGGEPPGQGGEGGGGEPSGQGGEGGAGGGNPGVNVERKDAGGGGCAAAPGGPLPLAALGLLGLLRRRRRA